MNDVPEFVDRHRPRCPHRRPARCPLSPGNRLEPRGRRQPGRRGGGEGLPAVGRDVEPPVAEGVELLRVHPVGLDPRPGRHSGRGGPRVAVPDRIDHRGPAVAGRPHEPAAVGRRRDRAAVVDPAGLLALEPVRAAVGGEGDVVVVGPVGLGEVADPDHRRRVQLGVVERGRRGEVGLQEHHRRHGVEVGVPEPADVAQAADQRRAPGGRADQVEDGGLLQALDHGFDRELAAGVPEFQVGRAVDGGAGAVHEAVAVEGVDLQRLGHPAQLGRDLGRLRVGPQLSHGAELMSIL